MDVIKRIVIYGLLVIQIILLVFLAASALIPSISPSEYSIFGVLGLFTPLLAIANIILFVFWICVRKFAFAGIAVVALVISWNVLSVCFTFNGPNKGNETQQKDDFSIMSYNVRLLDLYDWTGDDETRKNMLSFFKEKKADVLCLQEFYSRDNTGLDNVRAIQEAGDYEYVAFCNYKRSTRRQWGSVLFSKFPVLQNNNILINEKKKNLIQETQLLVGNDTIIVYNVHLHSNKLSGADLDVPLSEAKSGKFKELAKKTLKQSRSVFNKLKRGYQQRGTEVDLSALTIKRNPDKNILVCGDLNDLPSSYSYFNIRGNFKDAFLEKGNGIGATYNGRISFLRIDYIFHQERLRLNKFQRFKVPYSDHYPLMAHFKLPQ